MSDKERYLADLSGVSSFEVQIGFTDLFEPSLISEHGLPFVSMETEIEANTRSIDEMSLRKKYGCIPYAAPLYLWELRSADRIDILYIGQTVLQQVQRRFEGHASVVKLLAQYVNEQSSFIYYRLCSKFDLKYDKESSRFLNAIEHFSLDQAKRIIDDIEAYLIYRCKPKYNKQYKNKEKQYWKPFSIKSCQNINIP